MQIAKPRQEAAALVAGAIVPPPRHSTAVATAVAPPSAKTRQFEKELVKISDSSDSFATNVSSLCLILEF